MDVELSTADQGKGEGRVSNDDTFHLYVHAYCVGHIIYIFVCKIFLFVKYKKQIQET